jgi:integrase
MSGEKLLSEKECRQAKPSYKIYYLNDGGGLRLRIRPDGGKTWIFRYYFNKLEKSAGIGTHPKITLKIARTIAAAYKSDLASGKNPVVEKRNKRLQSISQGNPTFGSIAREWIDHNRDDWSENHIERNEGLLRRYLLPDLGRLPIDAIAESYLFSILKPVYDKGKKESARRARAITAQIFQFAKDTHRCAINPAKDMAGSTYFKKPATKHFKAISQADVPLLVAELKKPAEAQRLRPETACALLLAIYTGHRVGALLGAKWTEFDFVSNVWEVPSERMKSRRTHRVPLPRQAIEALQTIRPATFTRSDSCVFASKTKSGYLSENTLRLALHRLGYKVTVHGFRSLITDVLNENGFNADAVERQLDHQQANGVRRAYLRSEFDDIRRPMMQWFANWCDGIGVTAQTSNVINLQERRI